MGNNITFDSLARTELDTHTFETAISVGMKQHEMLRLFDVTAAEMDKWVLEHYGYARFEIVYDILRKRALFEYYQTLMKLGARGNVTAMNIMDKILRENAADNVVKIVFDNNVEKETEEDKLDDDRKGDSKS